MSDADRQVQRANRLIELGRYEAAGALLAPVLAAEPDHVGALDSLGHVHYLLDDHPAAERIARRQVAAAPDAADGYHRLAEALRFQDRLREAEDAAREALRIDPYQPVFYESLADVLRAQGGRVDECVALLDRSLALHPHRTAPLRRLARLYWSRGRLAPAIEAARRALAVDPVDVRQQVLLGELLLQDGREAEAVDAFTVALRGAPHEVDLAHLRSRLIQFDATSAPAARLRSMLSAALGQPDLGVPGAAGDDPGLRAAQLAVVDSLIDAQALDRAEAVLAGLPAADHGVRRATARLLSERMNDAAALPVLVELYDEGDASEPTMALLANVAAGCGDHATAVRVGRAGMRTFPHRPEFPTALASGLLGEGDLAGALAAARTATELAPYDGDAQGMLAEVLSATGDEASAEAVLHELVARYPDEVTNWIKLGFHQLSEGADATAALASFRRADELAPEVPDVGVMLGPAYLLAGDVAAAVGAMAGPILDCTAERVRLVLDLIEDWGVPPGVEPVYEAGCARVGHPPLARDDPDRLTGLGRYALALFHYRKDRQRAAALFDAVLAIDPDEGTALAGAAALRCVADDLVAGAELAARSVAVGGGILARMAHQLLVLSSLQLGRFERAAAAAANALTEYPDDPDFLSAAAEAAILGPAGTAEALAAARAAEAADPGSGAGRALVGRALLAVDRDAALVELSAACELDDDPAVRCWLGVGQALVGDPAAAGTLARVRAEASDDCRDDLRWRLRFSGFADAVPEFADWLCGCDRDAERVS